jgi:hypothetical protein
MITETDEPETSLQNAKLAVETKPFMNLKVSEYGFVNKAPSCG